MIDTTTKKGALLFLVQTFILASGSCRSNDPLHVAKFANATLAGILALDESMIPDNIEAACEDYVYWQDGKTKGASQEKYERPPWFSPSYKEGETGVFVYPWENK